MDILEIYPSPPSDFCKRLHALDPDLFLNWDRGQGVWSVWCKQTKPPYHVMSVVNDDGSYRPLDERTINIIMANRYFASHPEELIRKVVDPIEKQNEISEQKDKDNIRSLAADKSLKKRFDASIEKARSIPWETWTTPKIFTAKDGRRIMWKPHKSLENAQKPSGNDIDEMIKGDSK